LRQLASSAKLLTANTLTGLEGLRLTHLVQGVKASELSATHLVGDLLGVVHVAKVCALDPWVNLLLDDLSPAATATVFAKGTTHASVEARMFVVNNHVLPLMPRLIG
jgi:hypothetical protein